MEEYIIELNGKELLFRAESLEQARDYVESMKMPFETYEIFRIERTMVASSA